MTIDEETTEARAVLIGNTRVRLLNHVAHAFSSHFPFVLIPKETSSLVLDAPTNHDKTALAFVLASSTSIYLHTLSGSGQSQQQRERSIASAILPRNIYSQLNGRIRPISAPRLARGKSPPHVNPRHGRLQPLRPWPRPRLRPGPRRLRALRASGTRAILVVTVRLRPRRKLPALRARAHVLLLLAVVAVRLRLRPGTGRLLAVVSDHRSLLDTQLA
jgi:hypothetical protein